MDSINSIFLKNSFARYPSGTKKANVPKYKDILDNKSNDTFQYLDILYSDKIYEPKDAANLTELLKANLPIQSKLSYLGKLFILNSYL